MLKKILNEIYLEGGLLFVENETIFNCFKKLLKRVGVFICVIVLMPIIWAYKRLERYYNQ